MPITGHSALGFQGAKFLGRELKDEVWRKAFLVAFDCLSQRAGFHAVDGREVGERIGD